MSQEKEEERSADVEKEEDAGEKSILSTLLSRLIQMLPLDSMKNVYAALTDKKIKNNFTLQQVEEYCHKLLYEEGYAENFIKSPEYSKKTAKSIPPTKEEEFIIYMMRKFYGSKAVHMLTGAYRSKLLAQHSDTQIRKTVEQLGSVDQQRAGAFISQFANQVAHEESLAIGEEFSEEDLAEANVTKEQLQWWRQTFHIPEEKPSATDIDNSKLCDTKVELTEKAVEFLTQGTTPYLGTFSSLEEDYTMCSKHFLVHDGDYPDVDIDLKTIGGYQPSEEGSYGFLVMLKEDCEFYLENVGDAPIIVDAIQVRKGETIYIRDNACIEFGEPALVFKINWAFIANLKKLMKIDTN